MTIAYALVTFFMVFILAIVMSIVFIMAIVMSIVTLISIAASAVCIAACDSDVSHRYCGLCQDVTIEWCSTTSETGKRDGRTRENVTLKTRCGHCRGLCDPP